MPLQAHGYVTDVPYTRDFFRELAPAWLDHVALLARIEPPARRPSFTYCDLGCGQGVTTAFLAATHPAGVFHGVDLMPAHVEHARRFAGEIRLDNVRFHLANFAAAAEADLPAFDYIVAHGIYSWVDARVRADLRRFVDRLLKPGGLFYVSYNAIPGRAADLPLQRLVRALGRTGAGDSQARVAAALEVVHRLDDLQAPALAASPIMGELRQHKQRLAHAYLVHEFMGEHWEPLSVTEVRAAMREIGLLPVGSATLIENFDSFVLGKRARALLKDIDDEDARELARDFLIDQFFRRDMFVRDGRRLSAAEQRKRLFASAFALACPPHAVEFTTRTPAGRISYDNAAARAVVAALSTGPRTLAEIAAGSCTPVQDLLANTLVLCAAGAARPVEPAPVAVETLNGAIARRDGGPEDIRYVALPCGTALRVGDALGELLRTGAERDEVSGWRDFLAAHGVTLPLSYSAKPDR